MLWEKLNSKDTELWNIDLQNIDNGDWAWTINEEKNDLMAMLKRKDIEISQLKRKILEGERPEEIPERESTNLRTQPLRKSLNSDPVPPKRTITQTPVRDLP